VLCILTEVLINEYRIVQGCTHVTTALCGRGTHNISVIPRLHDEAGSTSWLYERTTSARRAQRT